MGSGQQGQSRAPLGIKPVGDQVEQGGTSPLRCGGDGGPEKGIVVELGAAAAIELKDAVFVGGRLNGGGTKGGI
jgi:hypothetical protein